MLYITILLYLLSLFGLIGSMLLSFHLMKFSPLAYRWGWLSLGLGFALLLSIRIRFLFEMATLGKYRFNDAFLSLMISLLLLIGMIGTRKIILHMISNHHRLQTLSQIDSLTQCLSRTEIFHLIHDEIERSRRNQRSFALLEIDIDNFKMVNDHFGHLVGDEILISLVKHTKETLRSMDSIGRIGGEEFIILLPETNLDQATETAERLRLYIANSSHQTSASYEVKIQISVGVAVLYPKNYYRMKTSLILTELVRKVDAAMYDAKNLGRNRIAIWGPSTPNLQNH